MPMYDIKVTVEYQYEVEAENDTEAEELGWHYEDHAYSGEVYSIEIEQQEEKDEEVELDEEVI